MEAQLTFGNHAVPVLLTILLAIIYKFAPTISDKWKAVIAVCFGIAFGVIAMFYQGQPITFQVIVDFIVEGFYVGAGAVGIYEIQRTATNPRE